MHNKFSHSSELFRIPFALALLPFAFAGVRGQNNYPAPFAFSTLAGGGKAGYVDGAGRDAKFSFAQGVAIDQSGNLYVADGGNDAVRKITPDGTVSTLARIPPIAGVNLSSRPSGVAVDRAGNVFVSLEGSNLIVKISPTGGVTTVAGNPTSNPKLPKLPGFFGPVPDPSNAGYADGSATEARFNMPAGLAIDAAGNVYVADSFNRRIRKISPAGTVTTFAGTSPYRPLDVDGLGEAAWFGSPDGLAIDAAGNLYVSDTGLSTIRKITPGGLVSTLAGAADVQGSVDGQGDAARFSTPLGLVVDAAGNVFVADSTSDTIREISLTGRVTTVAGKPGSIGYTDATGDAARFAYPAGLAIDRDGNLFLVDSANNAIRKGTAVPRPPLAITMQPVSNTVAVGTSAVLQVATNGPVLRFQWRKDGVDLVGATGPRLLINPVAPETGGNYSVVVNNDITTIESVPARLTVAASTARSWLINLSARSHVGTGDQTLIAGFVLDGQGSKAVLLRGVGPALLGFGVKNALLDPQLELFNSTGEQIDQNNDWSGSALAATSKALGALSLAEGSHDAALLRALPPGPYSIHITSTAGDGVSLVEAYDATPTTPDAHMTNVSARAEVGVGENVLIAGFVLEGPSSSTLILRGIGPALSQAGVTHVLLDPLLRLYDSGGHLIWENDDWSGDPSLANLFATVGAFPLPTDSKDAAILITLPPGAYSAQVSGIAETTGVALIEVYQVK